MRTIAEIMAELRGTLVECGLGLDIAMVALSDAEQELVAIEREWGIDCIETLFPLAREHGDRGDGLLLQKRVSGWTATIVESAHLPPGASGDTPGEAVATLRAKYESSIRSSIDRAQREIEKKRELLAGRAT